MSEVLRFAARVLERQGALVEPAETGVTAVLPEPLRRSLDLPELCLLVEGAEAGEEERACGYGSEALGRVAGLALGGGSTAVFRAVLPELPPQPPRGFEGLNVSVRVAGYQAAPRWTLAGLARYRASADDQREGLCRAAVRVPDGPPLPWPDLDLLPLAPVAPGEVPAEPLRAAFPRLLSALRARAGLDLLGFREAVARRRRRDGDRLRRYFEDVARDLRRRMERRGGEGLEAKLEALPAELKRKLAELEAESVVRARLELVWIAALLVPGLTGELEVRRRKETRVLEVHCDGVSRRWMGLRCDGCGEAALAFALCDAAAHVLCGRCWEGCGSGGRRPCFRCRGEPERGAMPEPPAGAAPAGTTGAAPGGAVAAAPAVRPTVAEPPPPSPAAAPGPSTPEPIPARAPAPARVRPGAAELRALSEAVLGLLRDSPSPLRNEEIRDALGLDAEGVRRALAPLIASGRVVRIGERRGARYSCPAPA